MQETNFKMALSRLWQNQDGNFAITAMVLAVPMLFAAGMAVDYSNQSSERSQLQEGLDAAALAAARDFRKSDAERIAKAKSWFVSNARSPCDGEPVVIIDGTKVTVEGGCRVPTTILKAVGISDVGIYGTATAVLDKSPTPACLLALDESADKSIHVYGATAKIYGPECEVHANSTSLNAMEISSKEVSVAKSFAVVGGYSGTKYSIQPIEKTTKVFDPYAGLKAPASSGCDYLPDSLPKSGYFTLYPGIYCGGLDLRMSSANLRPGVYVVKDGPFQTNSGTNITGEGVTFYLTGTNSYLDASGGADVSLSAQKDGPYKGLLFIQHPNAGVGAVNRIMGNSEMKIVGVSYFPTRSLELGGSGSFGAKSPFMMFVANRVRFFGNGQLYIQSNYTAAGYGGMELPAVDGSARLIN